MACLLLSCVLNSLFMSTLPQNKLSLRYLDDLEFFTTTVWTCDLLSSACAELAMQNATTRPGSALCVCGYFWQCERTHLCWNPGARRGCLPLSLPCCPETASLLSQKLSFQLSWLASELWGSNCPALQPIKCWDCRCVCHAWFLCGCWEFRLHSSCLQSPVLHTEPSPQSAYFCLACNNNILRTLILLNNIYNNNISF